METCHVKPACLYVLLELCMALVNIKKQNGSDLTKQLGLTCTCSQSKIQFIFIFLVMKMSRHRRMCQL